MLNVSESYFLRSRPQLIKDKNDDLFCFRLPGDTTGICFITQIDLNNWGPVQYLPPSPYIKLGADFVVKADDSLNIHLVSNHVYITTFANSLFYTCWDGTNWQSVEPVPADDRWFDPLIEHYRPDLSFSAEGYPIVTRDQYGYDDYFNPKRNGVGTAIKLDVGWHVNTNIALYRAPLSPKVLADQNNLLHYVWPDTSDGDADIYYTPTDFLTSLPPQNKQLSTTFHLHQNFPNLFNPSTIISWRLAVSTDVELTIYNLLGQRIRTLMNGKQPAGAHQVEWDGRDEYGHEAASGVYLYQLKVRGVVEVKKMLLVR